jgi:hypothetical protein
MEITVEEESWPEDTNRNLLFHRHEKNGTCLKECICLHCLLNIGGQNSTKFLATHQASDGYHHVGITFLSNL